MLRSTENGSLNSEKYDVMIKVTDFGIGIRKNEIHKLFQPKFRSRQQESRNLNPNGNGLGLRISNSIIKCMKGKLHVESELGKGSAFCINLFLNCDETKNSRLSLIEEDETPFKSELLWQAGKIVRKNTDQNSILRKSSALNN